MLQRIIPTLSGFSSSTFICKTVNLMTLLHQHSCLEEELRSILLILNEEQYWPSVHFSNLAWCQMISTLMPSSTGEILLPTQNTDQFTFSLGEKKERTPKPHHCKIVVRYRSLFWPQTPLPDSLNMQHRN